MSQCQIQELKNRTVIMVSKKDRARGWVLLNEVFYGKHVPSEIFRFELGQIEGISDIGPSLPFIGTQQIIA